MPVLSSPLLLRCPSSSCVGLSCPRTKPKTADGDSTTPENSARPYPPSASPCVTTPRCPRRRTFSATGSAISRAKRPTPAGPSIARMPRRWRGACRDRNTSHPPTTHAEAYVALSPSLSPPLLLDTLTIALSRQSVDMYVMMCCMCRAVRGCRRPASGPTLAPPTFKSSNR